MLDVVIADLTTPKDAHALIDVLDSYARDPMGGAEPLSDAVKQNLAKALAARSDAYVILAYVDGEPAGVANCFEGFSTFACQPLLNIHDIAVKPEFRGRGIGRALLAQVEQLAIERGCCKLTLEVLEGNQVAQKAYLAAGFAAYTLDPAMGQAMFWQKTLKD